MFEDNYLTMMSMTESYLLTTCVPLKSFVTIISFTDVVKSSIYHIKGECIEQ